MNVKFLLVVSNISMVAKRPKQSLKIPGLNGMELLRKMNDTNKYVRTVLMTAFEIEETIFTEYTKKKIFNGFFISQ